MGIGQAIIGFLSALPQIVSMVQNFMTWITKVSGGDVAGFVVKAGAVFDQLNKAQTEEEHANAAKSLADLVRRLPPK